MKPRCLDRRHRHLAHRSTPHCRGRRRSFPGNLQWRYTDIRCRHQSRRHRCRSRCWCRGFHRCSPPYWLGRYTLSPHRRDRWYTGLRLCSPGSALRPQSTPPLNSILPMCRRFRRRRLRSLSSLPQHRSWQRHCRGLLCRTPLPQNSLGNPYWFHRRTLRSLRRRDHPHRWNPLPHPWRPLGLPPILCCRHCTPE